MRVRELCVETLGVGVLVIGAGVTHSLPVISALPAAGDAKEVGSRAGASALPDTTCIVVDGGEISGSVSNGNEPVPDGVAVMLTFTGGPSPVALTRDGRYTLPQLARACADGIHWVDFELRSGGQGQAVQPDQWHTALDIVAPHPVSLTDPAALPDGASPPGSLELGTIRGALRSGGALAPDGTAVSAVMGPGGSSLAQTVLTNGGRYMLTTVGIRCGTQSATFLQMSLTVAGTAITITPVESKTIADLDIEP